MVKIKNIRKTIFYKFPKDTGTYKKEELFLKINGKKIPNRICNSL
jgi:hypothetical protein